jgi:hypothetical protein
MSHNHTKDTSHITHFVFIARDACEPRPREPKTAREILYTPARARGAARDTARAPSQVFVACAQASCEKLCGVLILLVSRSYAIAGLEATPGPNNKTV